MGGWALAVDIGAASVAAAVREGDTIQVVEFAGGPTLPPTVFYPAGQPPLTGLPAAERAVSEPGRAVSSPKRALAKGDTVTVGGAALPLTQVYAALLTAVAREAARGQEPAIPDRLILTYPAGWEERELAVLRSAAHGAGLPAPTFVAEPVAAAWELAADSRPGQFVAILDVGGGSIDTAVLRRTQDGFELAGPPGGLVRAAGDNPETTLRRGTYELLATITGAGLTPDQLAAIHVTGGGSRTPGIAALIIQSLGARPRLASSPETATVRGTAAAALGPPAQQTSGRRIPRRTTPAAAGATRPQGPESSSRQLQCLVPRMSKRSFSVAALAAAAVAVTVLVLTTMLLPHEHSTARPGPAHAEPASAPAAPAELFAVSCTAPTACTAVGRTGYDSAVGTKTLAERWNGTNWTIQPTPDPPGLTDAELHGVSCTSPTACIAVGGSSYGAPLAERWDGTNWRIQPTPGPTRLLGADLHGVSCTSPSACIAVGSSGFGRPLAERWDGTNWTVQPTPDPPRQTDSELYAVSCTSPSACIAVGGSTSGPPLAERWDGTNWTIQPTPDPPHLIAATYYGVSCTSLTVCTAVGETNGAPMAELWDGANWTIQHPPNSTTATWFGSVSCTSQAECTVVGPNGTLPFGLTAGRWDGTQWAATPVLQPAHEEAAALYGVSCTRPTACTAVGQSNNGSSSADAPLAETWDGTNWTIRRPPAPAWAVPPALYNLGGSVGSVWDLPEVRPATFYVVADGSGALTGMHWARWNDVTAVTSSATYYNRSGPCCTNADQHRYKVTVTLSGVQYHGGPQPGPYFSRMIITGPGFRTLTYIYKTFDSAGTWT